MTHNPYQKETKLYCLFEKIMKENELTQSLLEYKWNDKKYVLSKFHLHECVIKTKKYDFLHDYIKEYLKLYPNEIDVKNDSGNTALILASKSLHKYSTKNVIKILIKNGADMDIQGKLGETALIAAIYSINAVELLLNHGADMNIQDMHGSNALIYAIAIRKYDIIKLLLEHGADPNAQNNAGISAFMYSVIYSFQPHRREIIKLLLDYGADVNVQDNEGKTSIMYLICSITCLNNDLNETLELLLSCGAEVNIQDYEGRTILMYALENLYINGAMNVKTLMKYYANIDLKNEEKDNAVTIAFRNLEHERSIIDIILPTRKIFIEKINKNKKAILADKSKFWNVTSCDFKIINANFWIMDNFKINNININSFINILTFI